MSSAADHSRHCLSYSKFPASEGPPSTLTDQKDTFCRLAATNRDNPLALPQSTGDTGLRLPTIFFEDFLGQFGWEVQAVYLQYQGGNERTHEFLLRSYVRLRRIAGTMMRGERIDHTLQPTALVHEAVLRVLRRQDGNFNDSSHFYYTVVREMRRVLIDSARKADAKAWERMATEVFHDAIASPAVDRLDMLALDEGLEQLERIDSAQAEVAHFRLFFGMNHSEIASMLSVSERTVERKWAVARNRLALVIDAERKTRGS